MCDVDEDGVVKLWNRGEGFGEVRWRGIISVDLENALLGHPAVKYSVRVGISSPEVAGGRWAAVVLRRE